jgi:signal transduction histidine kinase
MILGIAADGRVDFCSGSPEDLCGRTTEELLGGRVTVVPGQRIRLVLGPGDGDPGPDSGTPWSGVLLGEEHEADLVCEDGTTRPVTIRLDRVRSSPGREAPAYVVVVGRVDVRLADLMATASHELRTPVTSILGYSELLRSSPAGDLPPTSKQLLGRIDRNARRLKGLIEDMLTLSQVEAGGFRLEQAPLDLREPLRRALDDVRTLLPVRELELRTAISTSPALVLGDSDRLERAFSQLLDNAVKFSLVGETIDVSLQLDGDDAVVTVEDRGVGIEPEEQRRVFERFYRGSRAHELVTQGSGLGLAVTEAILTGHGGRVEVDSQPGRGSCFTVRIPRAQPAR